MRGSTLPLHWKCFAFIRSINDNAHDTNFDSEVRKLSLDELAFCSIRFEERRLNPVIPCFKASNIREYMVKAQVSCLDRPEIFKRLKRLSAQSEGKPFYEIYNTAYIIHNDPLQTGPAEHGEQMNMV